MYQDRTKIHFLYLLADLILISLSFLFAHILQYRTTLIDKYLIESTKDYFLLFAIWSVILIFILNYYQLYTTDRSLTISTETFKVTKAVFFSSIFMALIIFGLDIKIFSRLVFIAALLILFLTLSSWRALKRMWIRSLLLRGSLNINVLIIGAGKIGLMLAEQIKLNPYLGFTILGFLDDNKTGNIDGCKILGKIEELETLAQKYFVGEIYVTIPSERQKVSEIVKTAQKIGKTVRIVVDKLDFSFGQVVLRNIGYIPLISYHERELHASERAMKRFLDIIGAGLGLILLFPLLTVIAFLIKIDSPGPILYISKRCGRRGRVFNFYKFRSMYQGADKYKDLLRSKSEVKGPVFKIRQDPRVTKIGRILRKYSLDELPQLINVIKGDMSLVGPRSPLPDETAKYDPWQYAKLDIKPGITCLWQIRGRSDLSFYKWIKWDLWYIDNWSLGLDFKIILWTIPAVLKRRGAY